MNSKKKKGLGKGLSALFGDQKKPENIEKKAINTQKALIGELAKNKYQPRTVFDESKLNELSQSIKKNGIIQPIAVRKINLLLSLTRVAGEGDGWPLRPAYMRNNNADLNDETLEVAIVENIQREDI